MAKILVVIPTYRRERFLNQAIKSLLAQTFEDWEAVIVDGTPEGSRIEVSDSRLKYFHERDHEISGLAQARNFGISQSDSKYIAYLDDDEYYYPTKLEVMHNFLELEAKGEFAYHDVIVSVVRWVGDTLHHICVPRPHWHPDGNPNKLIQWRCFIAGLQTVHTRNVFEKAGRFHEDQERGIFQGKFRNPLHRYDEDADLFRRIAECTRLERVPLQLAEYRVHGSNVNAWGIDYQRIVKERRLAKAEY